MALDEGDITASSGMAQAIYDQIVLNLEDDLGDITDEEKEPIREGWQKLAHAVATGVINHLISNMEISGIDTRGNVSVAITGSTATASGHNHARGTLSGSASNVTFSMINEGTGYVS